VPKGKAHAVSPTIIALFMLIAAPPKKVIKNKSANHQVDDAVVLGAARVDAGEISAHAAMVEHLHEPASNAIDRARVFGCSQLLVRWSLIAKSSRRLTLSGN
jgi:hypothetical protein